MEQRKKCQMYEIMINLGRTSYDSIANVMDEYNTHKLGDAGDLVGDLLRAHLEMEQ